MIMEATWWSLHNWHDAAVTTLVNQKKPLFYFGPLGTLQGDRIWTAEELKDIRVDGFLDPRDGQCRSFTSIVESYANPITLVTLPAKDLKQMMERPFGTAKAPYPSGEGAFMAYSSNVKITVDLSKTAQVSQAEPPYNIITPGERIVSLVVDGQPVDLNTTNPVTVAMTKYMSGKGQTDGPNAGTVSTAVLNATEVVDIQPDADPAAETTFNTQRALVHYINQNSPLTPVVDGRLTLTNTAGFNFDLCQ
jgi:hypothetical protein